MTTDSVSIFIQEAKDMYPHENPKLISDNGTCFISREFKKLVTSLNIEQIFTRRNHPQTNGKVERMVRTVREESLTLKAPQSYDEACKIIEDFQYTYNYQRLHSSINYLTPADLFFGRKDEILQYRKQKLIQARETRIKLNKLRFSSLKGL
jgi:transposase InsO family protein